MRKVIFERLFMTRNIPKVEELSLREKINQTIVIMMKKGETVDFTPGAAFFFGQIIQRRTMRDLTSCADTSRSYSIDEGNRLFGTK